MVKRHAGLILISMGIWAFSLQVLAQPVSWLDRSLSNWNRESNALPVLPEPGEAKLSSTRESLPRGGSPTRKCGGESCCTKRLETIWPCAELWDDDSIHGAGRLRWDVPPAGLSGVCVFGRQVCRNAFSRSDELAYRRVAYESSPGPLDSHYCRVCPLSRFRPTLLPVKDEHSRIPGPKRRSSCSYGCKRHDEAGGSDAGANWRKSG